MVSGRLREREGESTGSTVTGGSEAEDDPEKCIVFYKTMDLAAAKGGGGAVRQMDGMALCFGEDEGGAGGE